MINVKQYRELFNQILNSLEQNVGDVEEVSAQIDSLDSEIVQNYDAIMQLPKYSKGAVIKIFNDNKNLKTLLYRYSILQKNNMPEDAKLELEKILEFSNQLKDPKSLKQGKNVDVNSRMKEIIEFLQPHISLVGEAQAMKDLQRGLSLLNKNRRKSPIEAKNILKQDGVYGNKTFACFCDVCKNYTPRIIKKYIKQGIQNNVIFNTKNNQNVDTKQLMDRVCVNLERRI